MLTVAGAAPIVALQAALLAGGSVPPVAPPTAVVVIPDEPGVVVLPDSQPTLQAVVADVDGDGIRDVVRLVPGADGLLVADVWREDGDGWGRAGRPVVTITGEGGRAERAFIGRPARLLVRSVDGMDRVMLVRQPDYEDPDDQAGCCLLLDDLRLTDGELRLVPVARPGPVADAVHAIDFDGDRTDELLVTRSLPPLGGISYPTDARVFRWSGDAFAEPAVTELPIGSGDTPFILGDSDGEPGEEAAIITVTGRPDLYRLTLDDRGGLRAEQAGLLATDARAVPLADGRGIAVAGPVVGLAVMSWPRGEPLGPPVAEAAIEDGRLVGVVGGGREAMLVARESDGPPIVLGLPDLRAAEDGGSLASAAAAALAEGPLRPFVGPLPRGGPDGSPAVIAAGRLVAVGHPAEMATLAGAQPAGLVGRGLRWLAVHHAPSSSTRLDPGGGRLTPPSFPPASSVALVPLDLALQPEADGGRYDADTTATTSLASGEVAVSGQPFTVSVAAPPGSRVFLADPDASDPGPARTIDQSGAGRVVIVPRAEAGRNTEDQVVMIVVTPAGHAYRTEWRMRVIQAPPDLTAGTETPLGSGEVAVRGRTAPYAEVTVAGAPATVDDEGRFASTVSLPPWPTPIDVVARDPFGHEASVVVTGIGIFDYRALPWGVIVLVGVAIAAAVLYLRVPRPQPAPRPAADDAALEEMDPD